jgi:uncharacterized protein (TIGR03118 family)
MKNMRLFMRNLCVGAWSLPTTYCLVVLIALVFATSGCNKKAELKSLEPTGAGNQNGLKSLAATDVAFRPVGNVEQVTLVADAAGMGAMRTDPNLLNPWGMAFSPHEAIWLAANHKGASLVYGEDGNQLSAPVDIPLGGVPFASSPSGVVYNGTNGFYIPKTREKSKFIFSTEDGIIAAWSSGNSTVTVADRSEGGAVYKGIAIASNGGKDYIYATNFYSGMIDVFDQGFNYMNMSFIDTKIPAGYAPFGIKNIDGRLFVTYAMQNAQRHDDVAGPGHGYIDIFNTDGTVYRRFATQGVLNSPWGIVETETGGRPEHILVGNFGDGNINVFDESGAYLGQLSDGTRPITIPGLWALAFDEGNEKEFEHEGDGRLYFTAGPNQESDGVFGYLRRRVVSLTVFPSTKVVAPPASLVQPR